MQNLLAQLDPDSAAAQWFWWVSWIMVIGAVAVLLVVVVGVGRRWKRRQLETIEEERQARRTGRASERVDAWAASSERYVDHDKLPDEDAYKHENEPAYEDDDDEELIPGSVAGEDDEPQDPDDEDRDPFGLFTDKPYQDAEDEDDFDEGEDDDWDEEDNKQ